MTDDKRKRRFMAMFAQKRNKTPLGQWRKRVLERDEHICRQCREPANVAHHIQPKGWYKDIACDDDNGIALCAPCHDILHRNWQKYNFRTGELIYFR